MNKKSSIQHGVSSNLVEFVPLFVELLQGLAGHLVETLGFRSVPIGHGEVFFFVLILRARLIFLITPKAFVSPILLLDSSTTTILA